MEPILLITKADFVPYVELSSNLDAVKKLNTHIGHAQKFDLRPLLGDLLFYDLLANIKSYRAGVAAATEETPYVPSTQEQKYLDLLNGKPFLISGISIDFKGLVPALVHYTAARLAPNLNNFFSATGMVTKMNDLSNPVDPREISRTVQNFESLAFGYWNDAKSFLDIHSSDYLLWEKSGCNNTSRTGSKSGARIYGLN